LARIFQHEIDHLNGVLFPDIAVKVFRPEEDEEPPDQAALDITSEETTSI
jgi:peptide deformylase